MNVMSAKDLVSEKILVSVIAKVIMKIVKVFVVEITVLMYAEFVMDRVL